MTDCRNDYDFIIIGGGFYGCCLGLYLRSLTKRVLIVEAEDKILSRASRVNQARVHTGFHYPRSVLTASKSMQLHKRFMEDFPDAIVSDFQMLYAISRNRSKVSANRFQLMFNAMNAPIERASAAHRELFNSDMVEEVFACKEYVFNYAILREKITEKIDAAKLDLLTKTKVTSLEEKSSGVVVSLSSGKEYSAGNVFNITYSEINTILSMAKLPLAKLKFEIAELALMRPPKELEGIGVTVMDGPFFSFMPYPSEALYSLTHVRYTPHASWTSDSMTGSTYAHMNNANTESRHAHMIQDSKRYLPVLANVKWEKSIYDVKAVLLKNEDDDGRPILFQTKPYSSRVTSILGGKIDNIYDLFQIIKETNPSWKNASDEFLI